MSASERAAAPPPTLVLNADDVERLADWGESIDALRAAYAGTITDAMVPPRTMARGQGVWLRSLTCVSPSGEHVGSKQITVSTANVRASYLITLINRATAELVALIDGNHITGMRTAATSAIAVEQIAPDRPLHVAVLGSGFEAWNHLVALAAVRPVATARVFSPTEAKREAFAARALAELGIETTAVAEPSAAVAEADVVLCAARAKNEVPILQGAWLSPGATVVSIGSTLPEQREVDTTTLDRAARIVADMPEEVIYQTGDFLAAHNDDLDAAHRVVALADVVGGRASGREHADEIVVYKSVGSALQDIVLAEVVLRAARAANIGTPIAAPIQPLIK